MSDKINDMKANILRLLSENAELKRERDDAHYLLERLTGRLEKCLGKIIKTQAERDKAREKSRHLRVQLNHYTQVNEMAEQALRECDEEQNAKLRDIAERAIEEMESGDPVGTSDAYRAELDKIKEGAK